ncbi:MAG: leucine--tRNA ligase [Candidatus Schekmanbacteria bacterium]|nr:leucine--tRNA ligase [Candidatus Schekmanbacteria bacterium]
MKPYDWKSAEPAARELWKNAGLYATNLDADNLLYILVMFPYPSGARLHVGHWFQYSVFDTFCRFKRMQGAEVFQPMGYDAFGLPAENYAIKTGVPPQQSTAENIAISDRQFHEMGALFDDGHKVTTCEPAYYRWNQYLFLKLYHAGLAYRAQAPVNWCPSCQTVLANEQVTSDGECERCDSAVIQKELVQWFFRITRYADRLLADMKELDWPEETLQMQRNWIGRSEGTEVDFAVPARYCAGGVERKLRVYTTRIDTIYGATFMVLAPEHPLVAQVTQAEQRAAVDAYVAATRRLTELDRTATQRDKTGVFTGAYARNPLTGEEVPIWIADYVLASYGHGAIMAVPAHDERDHAFALKFGLPIVEVIRDPDERGQECFTGPGIMMSSGAYSGLTTAAGKQALDAWLAAHGLGGAAVSYRLRDWLISRQRYWGTPIPIVHCPRCGEVPLGVDQLPLLLPEDVAFRPHGSSPLETSERFMNTECPRCGGAARRDPDTMDTFVCSSWYFLRYPCAQLSDRPFDEDVIRRVTPVDIYVGGKEHATMHLLYARFLMKALRDAGCDVPHEPFKRLIHQGMILGANSQKMSKSRGNTVDPDVFVQVHGADVFRFYMLFGFDFQAGGPWSDDGIRASAAFLARVQRLVESVEDLFAVPADSAAASDAPEDRAEISALLYVLHSGLQSATRDLERFHFNTAAARMMEITNELYKLMGDPARKARNAVSIRSAVEILMRMLSPFAPHFAEHLWRETGHASVLAREPWPVPDARCLARNTVAVAVQINGKLRGTVEVEAGANEEVVLAAARQQSNIARYLEAGAVAKVIHVPGKILNVIVR